VQCYGSKTSEGLLILTYVGRYGTPYLLSLELPQELTALVWLAGPLSGIYDEHLIMRPPAEFLTSFFCIE
jgi:hypothetical protein